ncbi:hypothetical protein VTN96DRAFT_2256 [Rasamsonia emersonii]
MATYLPQGRKVRYSWVIEQQPFVYRLYHILGTSHSSWGLLNARLTVLLSSRRIDTSKSARDTYLRSFL